MAKKAPVKNLANGGGVSTAGDDWKKFKEGCRMIEATKDIVIRVTADHIKRAKPGDTCLCVLALAGKEQLGDVVDGLVVKRTKTFVKSGNRIVRYVNGHDLYDAIPAFDRTGVWTLGPKDIVLKAPKGGQTREDLRERWSTDYAAKSRKKYNSKGGKAKKPGSRRPHVITRRVDLQS